MAPPFKEAEFDIMYGEGICTDGDLLDMAVQTEVIDKSGVWYSFEGEQIGQGRENAKNFLKEHPDVPTRILEKLRDALGLAQKETKEPETVSAHRGKGRNEDEHTT